MVGSELSFSSSSVAAVKASKTGFIIMSEESVSKS